MRPSISTPSHQLARPAHGGVTGGDTGVDRAVADECGEFRRVDTVCECRAEMQLELLLAVEGDHQREREQRPRLPGERRVAPGVAPCSARDEVLPGAAEFTRGGQRLLDMCRPEDGLAIGEPRFV